MSDSAPAAPEKDLSPRERKGFALARRAAGQVLERRTRVLRLAGSAYRKASKHSNALTQVKEDLGVLVRFARAWSRGAYRAAPWTSVLYMVAALVYFVSPIDIIPDTLVGIGFIDDVAIIAAVVNAVRSDLDAFRAWEEQAA